MASDTYSIIWILFFLVLFMGVLWVFFIGRFWLKALLSGIRVTPLEIAFMRFRSTPVELILNELTKASKNGIILSRPQLELCYLAGGDVTNVVDGLIYAKAKGLNLSFEEAMKLDAQKYNVVMHMNKINIT
jgi:uncharacterized protein YqfA (UPF0365 family)